MENIFGEVLYNSNLFLFPLRSINRSFAIEMCAVTISVLFKEQIFPKALLKHSSSLISAWKSCLFLMLLFHSLHLTWRDMQHLTVLTSKRNQLHDEVHRWRRNGVGLEFNHLFGYGVLDAGAMVKMAKDWKTVPERFHCVGGSIQEPE